MQKKILIVNYLKLWSKRKFAFIDMHAKCNIKQEKSKRNFGPNKDQTRNTLILILNFII